MIDFYNAFISYKHAPLDIKIASHVQKQLEHFHVPGSLKGKIKHEKITRIFRDKDELPITSDLTETITNALEKSEYLIVICSTNTKESMWVKREIQTFLKTHTKDKIFTVLCDGEPQDVIPEELLTAEKEILDANGLPHMINVPVEPLSCDYRMPMSRADKEELPRLAAGLLGCSYDELQRRRRQYKLKRAAAIVAAAFAGVLAFGGYMLYSRIQINKAYVESLRSRSVYLANESEQLLENGKRADAIHLALASLPSNKKDKTPVTAPAVRAIADATAAYRSISSLDFTAAWNFKCKYSIEKSILSADQAYLAAVDSAGTAYCWDTETRELLFELTCKNNPVRIDIPNNETLVITYPFSIEAYNLPSGKQMWVYNKPSDSVPFSDSYISFSSTDIVVYTGGATVVRLSSRDGKEETSYTVSDNKFISAVSDLGISPDCSRFAYVESAFSTEDIKINIFDTATSNIKSFSIDAYYVHEIKFVDNDYLCVVSTKDLVNTAFRYTNRLSNLVPAVKTFTIYNVKTGQTWSTDLVYTQLSEGPGVMYLPSRNSVVFYVGDTVGIYDLETGKEQNKYSVGSTVVASGDFNENGLPEFILSSGEYIYSANKTDNRYYSFSTNSKNISTGAIGDDVYLVSKYDTDIICYKRSIQDDEWTAVKAPSGFSIGSSSQAFASNEDYLVTAAVTTEETGNEDQKYISHLIVSIIDLKSGKLAYTEDLRDVDVISSMFKVECIEGKFYITLGKDVCMVDAKKEKVTLMNLDLQYSDICSSGKIISYEKDYSSDSVIFKFFNYDGSDKEELKISGLTTDDFDTKKFNGTYIKSLDKAFLFITDTIYVVDMSSMEYDTLDIPDNWEFSNTKNIYVTTSEDKSLILFSDGGTILVTDNKLKEKYTIERNGDYVSCALFKDNVFYVVGDGYISVYDAKTGDLIKKCEMKYFTDDRRTEAWFENNGSELYIQAEDLLFVYDTETLFEIACVEQFYCYHKETERYYVYSYLSTYNIKPGYVKHYTVEELIEKGKRILNDAALDEATKSKYGL